MSSGKAGDNKTDSGANTPRSGYGLLRSSLSVGSMTMLSRVFGLIRDVVFAQLVGASAAADAFFVAFKVPNFFRRLFAEGAFNQAFVPVLSDYKQNQTLDQVRFFVSRVSGTLGLCLFALTLIVLLAPQVLSIPFAAGYWLGNDADDPLKFAYVTEMLRLTFPYLLLISLTALSGAILNTFGRFAVPAFTPVLLNICLITSALVVAPMMDEPSFALAWGVFAAGIVQLIFQLPFLQRVQMLPVPQWGWSDPGVKRVLRLMLPAIFGVSVSQINLLLDTLLAVFLPTGSVSWLYYSDRISELPLGVFGIAVATVILPSLSREHFSKNPGVFSSTLDWAIRMVLLFGLPAGVALLLLAEPILATLFHYGDFAANERNLPMAALSLQAYAMGLLAFMLVKVLAPGYFSREDMKTPVKIAIVAMTANMVMNLLFVGWLHYSFGLGHVGLALATTLSAFLNAGLLMRGLLKSHFYTPRNDWLVFALRLAFGLVLMALALWGLMSGWTDWIDWSLWQRIWRLLIVCISGASVYFIGIFLAGMRTADFKH